MFRYKFKYNHVPRQIVTPYKPSEDIEQTPLLLPPTPTSPDSLQTGSSYFGEFAGGEPSMTKTNTITSMSVTTTPILHYNPSFVPSRENTPKHFHNSGTSNANQGGNTFEYPPERSSSMGAGGATAMPTNPFAHSVTSVNSVRGKGDFHNGGTVTSASATASSSPFAGVNWTRTPSSSSGGGGEPHEYHEINEGDGLRNGQQVSSTMQPDDDDEMTPDKLDFGPSLLDEINSMFGSMHVNSNFTHPTILSGNSSDTMAILNAGAGASSVYHERSRSDLVDLTTKLIRKNSTGNTTANPKKSKEKQSANSCGTVKPISVKDERILNHAIEIANEISAR